MIQITNLSKNYGGFQALKKINFSVNQGEILALLGPNGAGKTTTMKLITGYLSPSSGQVIVDNEDIEKNTYDIQKRMGYLPENSPLYPDLNVLEHLEFGAELYSMNSVDKKRAISDVIKTCSLEDKVYFNTSELSKGYKQRLSLALALIHNPDYLILDEPTTGLDPNQIIEIRELIKKLGQKKTLILSTHIMQEVEAIADRVLVINEGEVVAEGTPDELMHGGGDGAANHKTRLIIKGPQKDILASLKIIDGLETIKKIDSLEKGVAEYQVLASLDIRSELSEKIIKSKYGLLEMTTVKQSMEDVFQKLTN